MGASAAIRGNTGIFATFKTGIGAAVEFDADLKKVEIDSEDKDDSDLTFREAAEGDLKDFTLKVAGIQSTAAGSLWRFLWDNPGAVITVLYGPHGNAVVSPEQPHFAMTVKNSGKPIIGGESRRGKERYDFEHELEVLTGPDLVTGV